MSSATDTFECSSTGVMLRYWNDEFSYTDTTYGDIPFALQDSSGNFIDQEYFEDTTGSYSAFFVEEIRPPNPEGLPNMYEMLFRYRNKTLTEIVTEKDSILAFHGAPMCLEISINDSSSQEWLRVTMVKWDEIFPRCRGAPEYFWVDITPNNPSRTFEDEFILMEIGFSSDNPEYSGFQFLVNLNYI